MISCRGDLFQHMQKQRERFKLIIVLFPDFPDTTADCAFVWTYTDKDQKVNLKDYSPIFLRNLRANALDTLARSFNVTIEQNNGFTPDFPAFVEGSPLTPTRARMYKQTMEQTFRDIKAGASLYVGSSDIKENEKGVCFGIIELFKPKFEFGDSVRFKRPNGDQITGSVVGLDFSDGKYNVANAFYVDEQNLTLASPS